MRAALTAALLLGVATLPGCVVVQTGVTNPMPGMTTVAVAPFINLSAERSVDGRRFALAYHAELQKIPGYQVIPVGVTEQAIFDLDLDLDGPEDALRLAEALGADAVVIGAVTDYTPYYPPRIGLQVSWYSPEPWRFSPGIPTDPQLGEAVRAWRFADAGRHSAQPLIARSNEPGERGASAPRVPPQASNSPPEPLTIVRAQSPEDWADSKAVVRANGFADGNPILLTGIETTETGPGPILLAPTHDQTSDLASPASTPPPGPEEPPAIQTVTAEQAPADQVATAAPFCPPGATPPQTECPSMPAVALLGPPAPHDPRKPIMAYTRLFDGSDAELTALLRDYVVLSGDLRSGGWEAYLHRTEDFIRFASHRMIVEMLTLHGGESKRRYVWMLHRHQH